MARCRLTMFGEAGQRTAELPLKTDDLASRPYLERLHRRHIDSNDCRYAIIRHDRQVLAMYLAPDLIPQKAVRLPIITTITGRWVTTAVGLGSSTSYRALAGPGLFFRQLDLSATESWMAPILMRFHQSIAVVSEKLGDTTIHQWEICGQRYYSTRVGGNWRFFGAGNTSKQRLEQIVEQLHPDSASTLLWAIGAIRLDT